MMTSETTAIPSTAAPQTAPPSFHSVKKTAANTYTFTLAPTHVSYANTLRRLILTGVETVAFRADMTNKGTTTDVQVLKNTTPMTNEMLAHRIGLLPINIKNPLQWDPDHFQFHLSVNGAKDATRNVYAGDFRVMEAIPNEPDPIQVDTAAFFPPHPITRQTCLLATLYPGEQNGIDIIAKATVGTGRENARFQPTSQCSYTYTRDTNPAKVESYFKTWLQNSKKIMDIDKTSEKYRQLEREFQTMEVSRCFLEDSHGEPYSFDFIVESIGVLDVPYIVQRACEVGEAMVSRYANIDKGKLPDDVSVHPSNTRILGYDFIFTHHDHTLGNLLETWLEQNHMDGGAGGGKTKVTFAGYDVPHPLRDEMVIRIGVEDGQESTARAALSEACRGCIGLFRQLKDSWMREIGTAAAPRTLRLKKVAPPPSSSEV